MRNRESGRVRLDAHEQRSTFLAARSIMHRFILKGFTPEVIRSDNAPEFVHGMIEWQNKMLGIAGHHNTPYKPSVQGFIERPNFDVARALQAITNSARDDWADVLPWVEYAINSTVQSTTGVSPFYYEHGFDVITPFDAAIAPEPEGIVAENQELWMSWKRKRDNIRDYAMQQQQLSAAESARYYNKGKPEHQFEKGSEVYVWFPRPNKLEPYVHGPYRIEQMYSANRSAQLVNIEHEKDVIYAHVDRLR